MKKYLTKERIMFVIAICVIVLGLTGCKGCNGSNNIPLNLWSEEKFFGKILVWPIGWVMNFIGSRFPSGQFAWGILFTTILVRTIAWPIYAKTNDMSLKMAVAQPEMTRIQQKYANRKDPQSQQRMQQEMMAVYKKYNISLLGCFTPFLQMPIFIAVYNAVLRIPLTLEGGNPAKLTLTDTSFLGIDNCLQSGIMAVGTQKAAAWSAPFIVGIVLAILVGVTMWLLNYFSQKKPSYQKNIPNQNQNNQMAAQMKIMNYMMIGMMVFASLSSNALAFYWVIGNIYSIIQSFINRYLNEKKYYKMKSETDILISNR